MAICPKYQGTMCSGYISISCDLVVDVTEDVQTSWIAANHIILHLHDNDCAYYPGYIFSLRFF